MPLKVGALVISSSYINRDTSPLSFGLSLVCRTVQHWTSWPRPSSPDNRIENIKAYKDKMIIKPVLTPFETEVVS
eukprot:scaffold1827_cov421-Prasinococcus_capsulatus_cf.AAC.33